MELIKESSVKYLLLAFMSFFTFVPVLYIFAYSFTPGHGVTGGITFDTFVSTITSHEVLASLKNTLLFCLSSIVLSHIFGFIFAFILTRMDIPHRSKFHTAMFLPIFISPLVLSLGFSFIFTSGGYYYEPLKQYFGMILDIHSLGGMIFVSSIWLTPFAYSFISSGMRNIGSELEDTGKITGASDLTVLRKITTPLLKPFVLSSIFLSFLLSFQEISIPLILGLPERIYVLSSYLVSIETLSVPPPYGKMACLGVLMIITSLTIAFIIRKSVGDISKYTVITGREHPRAFQSSKTTQIIGLVALLGFIIPFIFMPLIQIISVGITRTSVVGALSLETLSLKWLKLLFSSEITKVAISNSVIIATVTATLTVLITGIIAYISSRTKGLAANITESISWIPIAVPGVVLGLGFLWTFLGLGIGLYGTIFALIIAFLVRFSAFGTRMNKSLLSQQALELDEQANVCGSGIFTRIGKIIFPNAKSGMISIWVILYALFMCEMSTAIFLYSSSSRVITVTLFEFFQTARIGLIGSLATVQVLVSLGVIFAVLKFSGVSIKSV